MDHQGERIMEIKLKNDNESDFVFFFTFFWANNIFIFYSFFLFFCLFILISCNNKLVYFPFS